MKQLTVKESQALLDDTETTALEKQFSKKTLQKHVMKFVLCQRPSRL